MPGVAEINVVVRNGALIEGWREGRIQRQVAPGTGIGNLGVGDDARNSGKVAPPGRLLGASKTCRNGGRNVDQTRAGTVAELIGGGVVDASAVIGALMPVPVALIGAAKLEKVIAFQHGEVVPEKQVMPIPESCADVLSVHVV